MPETRVEITYRDELITDLSAEHQADFEAALRAREQAYAPYSHFQVGALLRMNDDTTYPGWNAECIDFVVTHAEEAARVRVPKVSRDSGVKRVTIVGAPEGDYINENFTAPCGGCRQKLMEYAIVGSNPEVVMASVRGRVRIAGLRDLLQLGFFPDSLSPAAKK